MKNKNNVYILMGNGILDRFGGDVLGVYDSKAKARAAAKKYEAAVNDDVANENYDLAEYEGYYIIEKIVNKAANDDCILRMAEGNEAVEL